MAIDVLKTTEVLAAKDGDHADGGGLFLRVKGGAASWVLRYTSPVGRRREMGLGVVLRGSMAQAGESVASARKAARVQRDLIESGLDPIDERRRQRAAAQAVEQRRKIERKREQITLARAARGYHERVVEPRMTAKHGADWIASLENHVPGWLWHKPVATITPPELLAALSGVRSVENTDLRIPETLVRVRQRLDAVFEDAIFHGACTTNPAAAVRRKMRETMPLAKPGQFAALPFSEAPAFMRRLRLTKGVAARCLEFAMLTAARTNEVRFMRHSEVDLIARVWTVPAERMKVREAHVVFLSDRAIEILAEQRALQHQLVFASTLAEKNALSGMAMLMALGRLGMRDRTTVHGLCRATFSTWAYETATARPEVIEACLAHREEDRVKAAYNRATFNGERRALMFAWARYLTSSEGLGASSMNAAELPSTRMVAPV